MKSVVRTLVIALPLFFAAAGVHAAIIPGCSGSACRACDLVTLAQNIMTWLIGISVFIAALVVAFAGMKMVTAGEGSHLLGETVSSIAIGMVILLGSWLIIDTGLKVLLGGDFGPWNTIKCVENPIFAKGVKQGAGGVNTGGTYTGVTGGGEQCDPANTACNVDTLKAVGYTEAQANAMSCIAMTESSGNPNAMNPDSSGGACGTFQIRPGYHWIPSSPVYQALPPECQAAGACQNAQCNALAAYQLSKNRMAAGQSPYADWTCANCNAKAQACIDKYDPGH